MAYFGNGGVMIKNPYFNEMVLVSEKKNRKADGATAILNLMASTLDFLDKVDACVESVSNTSNKQKLDEYKSQVETMYTEMAEMSKSAIHDITSSRHGEEGGEVISDEVETKDESKGASKSLDFQGSKPISLLNAPVLPRF